MKLFHIEYTSGGKQFLTALFGSQLNADSVVYNNIDKIIANISIDNVEELSLEEIEKLKVVLL